MQGYDGTGRKCIGVFIAKPEREYQTGLLCGIYKAAFERDMNVAVFGATLAGGVATEKETELDIYTVPNYDKLAGVIYVPDWYDYKHVDEMIEKPLAKAVKEKRVCAVALNADIDGIPAVYFDTDDTVRTLMEHVIKEHGCRDIAFMSGRADNPYSRERVELYERIMSDNGLEVLSGRVYYGDFWYNEGENFVEQLVNSTDGMPEAIVCINGPMACSVYRALRKKGYVVPNDVLLVCYTDEPNDFRYITSTTKSPEFEGYHTCKKLLDLIDGKEIGREKIKCEGRFAPSLSCGCVPAEKYDHSKMDGIDINAPMSYFSEFNFMSTELLNRPGYREMFWALDWYTIYIPGIRGIYFCLCEGWERSWEEGSEFSEADEAAQSEQDMKSRMGFTERLSPYYYRINHDDGTHESFFESEESFTVSDMFPKLFDPAGEPSSYIFRSLHFGDRNFGYIVLDYGQKMQTYDLALDYWIKNVVNAMEYHRKLGNEKYLYSSDFMTGLINRNGFNRMMPSIINEAHRGNYQLFFAVCDLNGLKYINDTFGHIEGDNSIRIAADAVSEADFPGFAVEKAFRIGGDEYVKAVIGHFTDEDVANFKGKIYRKLEEYNRTSGKPYPVYLSVGVVVKNPDEVYTSDSLISEADKLMFSDKKRLREVTGFDPKRAT